MSESRVRAELYTMDFQEAEANGLIGASASVGSLKGRGSKEEGFLRQLRDLNYLTLLE